MGEFIFGQTASMPSAEATPAAAGSLPRPEILQVEQLSAVAGGLNPQPLPPYRHFSM